jgi:hypothetical protein
LRQRLEQRRIDVAVGDVVGVVVVGVVGVVIGCVNDQQTRLLIAVDDVGVICHLHRCAVKC